MSEALRVAGLRRTFRSGGGELVVLDSLDFTVKQGEILAVVGASGEGKSTLLNCVGGLDRPTEGEIRVAGVSLQECDEEEMTGFRNEHVGFVFQFHYLLPDFTALENVMLPALMRDFRYRAVRERASGLLEEVGLPHRMGHLPGQLSGGERQRVAVARALINSPTIVLADEPTGNLDHESAQQVFSVICDVSRRHERTVLVVTHNTELASRADRVLRLVSAGLRPAEKGRRSSR